MIEFWQGALLRQGVFFIGAYKRDSLYLSTVGFIIEIVLMEVYCDIIRYGKRIV